MKNEEYKPKHKIGDSLFFDGKYHKIIDIFKYKSIDYVLEYGIYMDAKRADELSEISLKKSLRTMTNKEKAEWIANSYDGDRISIEDIVTACMGMAAWKEEQMMNKFKIFLENTDWFKKIVLQSQVESES